MSIIQLKAAVIQAEGGCRPGVPDHFDLEDGGPFSFPCCYCTHNRADLEAAPCQGCCHSDVQDRRPCETNRPRQKGAPQWGMDLDLRQRGPDLPAGEDAAWTVGPREQALAEARHYAAIYSQDGPVEIYEIHKTYTLIPA